MLVVRDREYALRIRARLLDLSAYNLKFDFLERPLWEEGLARVCGEASLGPTDSPPTWEHTLDVDVTPSQRGRAAPTPGPSEWLLFFDGGCWVWAGQRLGSGGWVLVHPHGLVEAARAVFYGET